MHSSRSSHSMFIGVKKSRVSLLGCQKTTVWWDSLASWSVSFRGSSLPKCCLAILDFSLDRGPRTLSSPTTYRNPKNDPNVPVLLHQEVSAALKPSFEIWTNNDVNFNAQNRYYVGRAFRKKYVTRRQRWLSDGTNIDRKA